MDSWIAGILGGAAAGSLVVLTWYILSSRWRGLRHLVISHDADWSVRPVAHSLSRSQSRLISARVWRPRFRRVLEFGTQLMAHLDGLSAPRLVLIVAHADKTGRLYWRDPLESTSKIEVYYLEDKWWRGTDNSVGIWAIGCYTSRCPMRYALDGSMHGFLGYETSISFNFLTARSEAFTRELLARLAARFENATSIDDELRAGVVDEYVAAIMEIGAFPDPQSGDRITQLLIEEQIEALTLLTEG